MVISKYPVLQYGSNKDFYYSEERIVLKGKREKKLVDAGGKKAFLKYQAEGYVTSELCSEKIAYELAKELGFECARVELARDENGKLGILNYLFSNPPKIKHTDIAAYLKEASSDRAHFYTLTNIKSVLDNINADLFRGFVRIMLFDTLIGEQDRHEENWGVLEDSNGIVRISPLYDNGDSLARDLASYEKIMEYESGTKNFETYSNRSLTCIMKEPEDIIDGISRKYRHFELIDKLITDYPELVQNEVLPILALEDKKIEKIVHKVPSDFLTEMHKAYIIKYIIMRKQKLVEKCKSL